MLWASEHPRWMNECLNSRSTGCWSSSPLSARFLLVGPQARHSNLPEPAVSVTEQEWQQLPFRVALIGCNVKALLMWKGVSDFNTVFLDALYFVREVLSSEQNWVKGTEIFHILPTHTQYPCPKNNLCAACPHPHCSFHYAHTFASTRIPHGWTTYYAVFSY